MEKGKGKVKVYHDGDADLGVLKGKRIGVIGYGIQGSAQALCLRDSGLDVSVGLREGGESWRRAERDGLKVLSIPEAAKRADVVMLLIPDMVQRQTYYDSIEENLDPGDVLYFSHGFSITYGLIRPPEGVDVVMVAPKSPGQKLREAYLDGFGVPALLAVYQDRTGQAKQRGLALAKGMGFTRAGVVECTFDQETLSDLFGEQAVLCGGVTELIKAGFETLVEDGFPAELAYFECLHELKLIVDLIWAGGMENMWSHVSETARYGGRTRGSYLIDDAVRGRMRKLLADVKDGTFAHEWIVEHSIGCPKFEMLRRIGSGHPIEVVGAEIRKMFERKDRAH